MRSRPHSRARRLMNGLGAPKGPMTLAVAVLALCPLAHSAAPPKAPPPQEPAAQTKTVGVFFWHDSPNDRATLAGVKLGLAAAKVPVRFVERHAKADAIKAVRQLTELRAVRCDLVLALGTRGTQLAQKHLPDLPIVFAAVTNPVTAGIVANWSHTSERLCGASNWIAPASVLEVFQLAVPRLRKLGMLRSGQSGVVSAAELAGMRQHLAQHAGTQSGEPKLELCEVVVDDANDLPKAVAKLRQQNVDAIWIPIDLTIYQNVPAIERALEDDHLPLLTTAAAGVRNGALVAAAVDYGLHGRRAAALIQRVLANTSEPPKIGVDRMRSSLVVVNLKAARRNQIELPLSLLALADELIAPENP